MSNFEEYRNNYKFIRMERHEGVLEATFHTNGGTLHVTRWQLSPADASGFWALDVSDLGGTTRLAY